MNLETLKIILVSMEKINDIDRSHYFNNYYNEVKERIRDLEKLEIFNKIQDWKKEYPELF